MKLPFPIAVLLLVMSCYAGVNSASAGKSTNKKKADAATSFAIAILEQIKRDSIAAYKAKLEQAKQDSIAAYKVKAAVKSILEQARQDSIAAENAKDKKENVLVRVWDGKVDSEWYWENPKQKEFTITTAAQLAGFAQLVNGGNDFSGKTIKLGANIMLNDTARWRKWEESEPSNIWTPIGSYTNENNNRAFSGTFDGGNYVVSGLYIQNSNNYQGLFGYISKAAIKNLGIAASYVNGGAIVGGLAGYNNNSIITNCYSMANLAGRSIVGGLVGNNKGSIVSCYAMGNVYGSSVAGGLVGSNEGTIANCYATGSVYTSSMAGIDNASIGGLVGDNNWIIMDCYAVGKVTGGKSIGGLVGNNRKIITNCYAKGNVASYGFGFGGLVGGLVGENSGKIANCYATGNVEGRGNQGNNIGGLVGSNGGTLNDSYATGNVSGSGNIGGLIGFDGGSTIGFNTKTTTGSIITNCYATGDVEGSSNNVGGLIGIDISSSVVKNSFATGNVTGGHDNVGGLIGSNGGTIINSYAGGDIVGKENVGGLVGVTSGKITITNCYAVGKVSGVTGSTLGGLIGVNEESTVKSSYYDRQASTQVDINKGEPKSTAQMKQQATFENWDFSKLWKIDADKNDGYPYLQANGNITETMNRTKTNKASEQVDEDSFNDGYEEGDSGDLDGMLGGLMSGGGDSSKDGARSRAEIMAVVNQRVNGLKSVYNRYLKNKPGFTGKVVLKFTIAPSGDITTISVVSSTTGYPEFDNAIKEQVSKWKWKQIKSGNTTPTIPFSFKE